MSGTAMRTLTAALALMVGATAARSQEAAEDGRWLPYLGCWVDAAAPDGPMTCIVAEGEGVAFLTVEDAAVTDRRAVVADGRDRPVEAAGCTGTEAAQFSSDGYRVFTNAALDCSAGLERESRGLMAMVDGTRWIEVRALGFGESSVAWVKRYRTAPSDRVEAAGLERAAPANVMEAARVAAAAPLSVDDLIEANEATDPEAVRAWIAEQEEPLERLDADRLIQLADAGVPPEVIDVAVAVSFPDRFAVADGARVDDPYGYRGYGYDRYGSWGLWSPFYPFGYDPFYARYGGLYGYGSYGYYGSGFHSPGSYGYTPRVIVVQPETQQPRGRAVNGRGYTRGGSGSAAFPRLPRINSPSSSRIGTSSGSSSSTSTAATSSSTSSSKGKAKPRGGG